MVDAISGNRPPGLECSCSIYLLHYIEQSPRLCASVSSLGCCEANKWVNLLKSLDQCLVRRCCDGLSAVSTWIGYIVGQLFNQNLLYVLL